jgi:cysteine/O-acetylserine efflux protein
MAMSIAMRFGYTRSLRFLIGIFVGFFIVMLACGFLNVVLVELIPQIKSWLNFFGALYMGYLAIHILLSKPVEDNARKNSSNSFKAGFSMQFLNLKVILYGATVYSTFIVQTYQNPMAIALFAPVLAFVGFLSTSGWAIGGNIFRSLFIKYNRTLNIIMSGLLIYTAIASLLH